MRPPHPRELPRQTIIDKLRFDSEQIETYDLLITAHQSAIRSADERIHEARNELYRLLNTDSSSERVDSAKWKISNIQYEIETIHFNHFLEIKKLCKENQLPYFNDLTSELESLFNSAPIKPA